MSGVRGGILSGGKSRRMGQPKHLLRHGDRSFTAIAAAALAPACVEVVMLGEVILPEDAAALQCLADLDGARGPLAGIGAALQYDAGSAWIVVACDMPLLAAEDVAWLLEEHRRGGQVATMPLVGDRPLPTFAVYGPEIAEPVGALIAQGRGPIRLARRDDVHTPTPRDPAMLARLRSANTPEELAGLVG